MKSNINSFIHSVSHFLPILQTFFYLHIEKKTLFYKKPENIFFMLLIQNGPNMRSIRFCIKDCNFIAI